MQNAMNHKGRTCFLKTDRLWFSVWTSDDLPLARTLWGDPEVTRYICASGRFAEREIADRLQTEISNGQRYGVQYWPVFETGTGAFVGCCGLRPHGEGEYEIGVHLRPAFWRQGYASEAAKAVIRHAFSVLRAEKLFAGHNPNNIGSKALLGSLGFTYIGDEFYEPTGLNHPSYALANTVTEEPPYRQR